MNLFRTVVAGSALYLGYKLLQPPTAYPVPIIINLPARRSRQQPRFRAEVPDPTPRRVPSPEPPTSLEPVHPPSPVEQLDQQADQATIAPLPTETEPTIESPTAAQLLKDQQAVEALIDLEPVQEEVVSYLDRRNQEIARQQQQIQDLMAEIEALEALKVEVVPEVVPEEDQLAQYAEAVSRPVEEMSTKLFFGQVAYPRRR